jgi:hypothetical protein
MPEQNCRRSPIRWRHSQRATNSSSSSLVKPGSSGGQTGLRFFINQVLLKCSLNDFARAWHVFDDLPESRAKATLKAPELKNDVARPYLGQQATLSGFNNGLCISSGSKPAAQRSPP